MVRALEKKEEYREIKPYWIVRLMNFRNEMWETDINDFSAELNNPFSRHNGPEECIEYYGASFRRFDQIHFKNGFARWSKPAPAFDIGLSKIRIDTGKPEWGAEPEKYYFVLELGDIQPQAARKAS